MKFCILASGSRGNSIYVETYYGRFLVDVGLSARQIEQRLLSKEIPPESIDAIVLTHAHKDHVRGVGVFANRHRIPIHGHRDTLEAISTLLKPRQEVRPWTAAFQINGIHFTPFQLSHDCDPTFGYLIEENSHVLAICTDLGIATDGVKKEIQRAQAMVLESNHDPEMLMEGPYPWYLKERISSRLGHLSNHDAGELLTEVMKPHLQRIVLGHLSEENNAPELALQTVLEYVGSRSDAAIDVIEQRTVSDLYEL